MREVGFGEMEETLEGESEGGVWSIENGGDWRGKTVLTCRAD
jgi:hypothetical protein